MTTLELERPPAAAKQPPGVEQTDLVALVAHREAVDADATMEQAYQRFRGHQQDFCAVLDAGSVVGLFSRARMGYLLGHRFGFSVWGRDPVRRHLVPGPLVLRQGTQVRQALESALGRPGREFNEDVILIGGDDRYLGIIPVPELVRLQSALVEERFRVQESMNRRLVEVSRQAGMAEVASGVLHNVGNVLNSVNVSAQMAVEMVQRSKLASLEKVVAILEQNRANLGAYLTDDPKGRLVPEFLLQVTSRLKAERDQQLAELNSLVRHLNHIKNIVSTQQQYAKVSGVLELVPVQEIVEDGLRLNAGALARHGVDLLTSFEPVPPVMVDKHKVLQILINLIRNAKYAADHSPGPKKWVRVAIDAPAKDRVRIQVEDNGVGIAPENLKRIFAHGFTTKKDGHGFGLHSSALAAREMGGTLRVHSDGPGRGAVFSLELPVKSEAPVS